VHPGILSRRDDHERAGDMLKDGFGCVAMTFFCKIHTDHYTLGAIKRVGRRGLATAAETLSPAATSASGHKPSREGITTAIVLNRAPILTKSPTPFERAYYHYQQRIQRALHNPFPYDFYFKPGAPLEGAFNLAEARRDRKAFGKGFGMDAEGAFTPPAAGTPELGAEEDEPTPPRRTEADDKADTKSLDRYGQRNLYLLLQRKIDGKTAWQFPEGSVETDEMLHEVCYVHRPPHEAVCTEPLLQAAERGLVVECGPDMNTWVVSRNPIGVYKSSTSGAEVCPFLFGIVSIPLTLYTPSEPYLLLQSAYHGGPGQANGQERRRLCLVNEAGNRKESGSSVLGGRQGYAV
jgi:large subunit ribosomal protein L46